MAFLTGSRVYGVAGPTSDIDLVIRCDDDTCRRLMQLSEDKRGSQEPFIRFGELNIIALGSDEEYDRWKRARDRCLAEAPVTKDRAIDIHREEKTGN